MEEEQTQDVNTVEETTDTSSEVEQTAVDSEQETQEETVQSASVPYERFKEVNDTLKAMRDELAEMKTGLASSQTSQSQVQEPIDPAQRAQEELIEKQFKQVADKLGYVSQDKLLQKERDQILEQTFTKLESQLNGSDGRPKFERQAVIDYALKNRISDPEVAYKLMNEAQLDNWKIEQAIKGKGITLKTETSNGSGSQSAQGASMDVLKAKAAAGDQEAIDTLIARHASPFGV